MKNVCAYLWLGGLVLLVGCGKKPAVSKAEQPKVLARVHFVGTSALASNTNAPRLREIWALRTTQQLRDQTFDKLASALPEYFHWGDQTQPQARVKLLRPLLDDLISQEWVLESGGATNQSPEWVIAVRSGSAKTAVWSTNLWQLIAGKDAQQPVAIQAEGFGGWSLKGGKASDFQFIQAGDWSVMSWGDHHWGKLQATLKAIRSSGRLGPEAQENWLEAEINWPLAATGLPAKIREQLPHTLLSLAGKGDQIRSQMRLRFEKPVHWPLDAWQIPTNTISDPPGSPLVSFSATRGIAPWIRQWDPIKELKLPSIPNQLYVWSQTPVPFQTFFILPLANVTNVLQQVATNLATVVSTNLESQGIGQIRWLTNQNEIFWQGLPLVAPYLRPVQEPHGQFLMGGIFPPYPRTNPPPAELLRQVVSKTNLLYYGWEITQPRIGHWRTLVQLYSIVAREKILATNLLSQQWLEEIAPSLHNSITEITVKNASELEFARSSPIGLTGFELMLLTRWLEAPGFPFSIRAAPASAATPSQPVERPGP